MVKKDTSNEIYKIRHNVILTKAEGKRLNEYLKLNNLKNVSQLVKKVIG